MRQKQPFLSDDQIEGIREVVKDLESKGLLPVLRGDAIENVNNAMYNPLGRGREYMSPEQAWVTAVVSRLLSNGYEIRKKDGTEKKD